MIAQSKVESAIETTLNIGSGFILSLLLWVWVVAPLWNLEVTVFDNVAITSLFTVVSVVRSYVWRRYFNKRLHRKLEELLNG